MLLKKCLLAGHGNGNSKGQTRRFGWEPVGKQGFRSQSCCRGIPPLPLSAHPGQHVKADRSQRCCRGEAPVRQDPKPPCLTCKHPALLYLIHCLLKRPPLKLKESNVL